MSARAAGALARASWYQARTYRLSLAMQIGGILLTVVPTFFIARALQDTMADTIAGEAEQFFAFILVGSVALMFSTAAMTTLHAAIAGGISTGYFESLLMTRAPVPSILAGMTLYGMLQTVVRGAVMMIAGTVLGASVAWSGLVPALAILALLVLAHWGVGLIAAALVIAFRTAGPLTSAVMTVSVLFGGVYYPVSAIPSWLGAIAKVTPLAYGLRAMRRVLLQGESMSAVVADVAILALIAAALLAIGALSIRAGLRYARRAGTLGSY